MIVQERCAAFPTKVNFVDENGVILGYDIETICGEDFGWFLDDAVCSVALPQSDATQFEWTGWLFDPDYFMEFPSVEGDEGGLVVFRLVKPKTETSVAEEKFLHLFNFHNGYYSHGFSFAAGSQMLQEGYF